MKYRFMIALLLALATATGCARVMGPYYLEQKKYEEGIEAIGDRLRQNPDDAASSYYLGRYYLALDKADKALPYFEKAVALDPEDADYIFWTGVAHWALNDLDQERAAYEKALLLDPNHISANLYLGHGYLEQENWDKALAQYETVIRLDKYNPEALYNRAVALGGLGRTEEEIVAWKQFLTYYPAGSLGMEAVERLNSTGDFTYRNHVIGKRYVTLRSMVFKPGSDEPDRASKESLHVLSAMLKANTSLILHIVAYVKNDPATAKDRAQAIRDYMLGGNPEINPNRLPLSWFGTAETIDLGKTKVSLDESVNFITDYR